MIAYHLMSHVNQYLTKAIDIQQMEIDDNSNHEYSKTANKTATMDSRKWQRTIIIWDNQELWLPKDKNK